MKKEEWKQIGWFFGISMVVIFLQAILSYQIKQSFPKEGSFLGIMFDNIYLVWGFTMVLLIVIWYLIKKSFGIKTTRRKLK